MTKPGDWSEKHLGYAFGDEGLLQQALTHRSASVNHNERLEFLGDAVLGAAVAHAVYQRRPEGPEGDLTRLRAMLVRRETLADIAREIELAPQINLGPGENRSGGSGRSSVLANAFEAVIGAVFLDGGYPAADTVIDRVYASRLSTLPDSETLKDPKTRLQERLQAEQISPPVYSLSFVTGPAHAQKFEVACRITSLELEAKGTGTSRRRAEQDAAARLLELLPGA